MEVSMGDPKLQDSPSDDGASHRGGQAAIGTSVPANAGAAADGPGSAAARPVLPRILKFNEGRRPRLVRLKLERMALDAFAFFRGADHLFGEDWPELGPPDKGPSFPICGDLHLENFGAYRDDAGELHYDINDFDEAVVASCSLDLVRCTTSILLAAEVWRLTPLLASGLALSYLEKFREWFAATAPRAKASSDGEGIKLGRGPIWTILGRSARASQADLLDRITARHKDGTRRILRVKNRRPEVKPERAEAVRAAVEAYGSAAGHPDAFRVLDVTGRAAGVGSLGLPRFTVLVAGGGPARKNRLLDVKGCHSSALQPCSDVAWPHPDDSDAARVVRAQRMLQAGTPAGLDVLKVGDTEYLMREMIPEESRSSLAQFNHKPKKLRVAIEEAAYLTALSHRRGAEAYPDGGGCDALRHWIAGPALDSMLAAAVRFAERTRVNHHQFCAELRAPNALPRGFKKSLTPA
jgi:uncharacterized protein (DUF2252 family)